MRSPAKRALSFMAEYQFGDENILTATHHEELRLKNEERVRNAKSILKMEGLTLHDDTSATTNTHNAKKIQQELDRHDEIDQHNLILLDRLERIHRQLPKQFDISHHCEAVQNAPRASNAGLRQRQQDKIDLENKRMKKRLHHVKGTFDLKRLATDAEKHFYFSDQLSKVARRRKAQESCKHLLDISATKIASAAATLPENFYVYQHGGSNPNHRHGQDHEDEDEHEDGDDRPCNRASDLRSTAVAGAFKLPLVQSSAAKNKYMKAYAGPPTLANSGAPISAADLLRGFK